jgi:hypothetical protein
LIHYLSLGISQEFGREPEGISQALSGGITFGHQQLDLNLSVFPRDFS